MRACCRNGQYHSEHLCHEVIRGRLAANLITATGPVNALGDQGRDGETYFTYLPEELGAHGTFLARVSAGAAAFCCTIQAPCRARSATRSCRARRRLSAGRLSLRAAAARAGNDFSRR